MPLPRLLRRVLLPAAVAIELVLLVCFVALSVAGVIVAPFDRRLRLFRIGAFAVTYLAVEVASLGALLAVWLVKKIHSESWWQEANTRLLGWALGAVIAGARRWCGFTVTIEERPHLDPLDGDQPVVVLARYGGPGDSFVLVWLLIDRYDRCPRVVLKEVLRWEPLIDVGLSRLGACFLPKRPSPGKDPAALLSDLSARLDGRDALLIFPEGGNWTPRRRSRAIAQLRSERRHRSADAAVLMEHVLPPRPAGVFACIDARPELTVVVGAHTGLDELVTAGEVWEATPFRQPMTVRWWPVASPPSGQEERLRWFTTEWAIVDEWIDSHRVSSGGPVD